MSKTQTAFDLKMLQVGNKGLGIDHESVSAQVDTLLVSMSLAEKFNEIRGRQLKSIEGLYHSGGNSTLGIPTLRMVDGPRGARAGRATAFPVAIARAASFDVTLERRVGLAIGREVAAKNGNVVLAPCINLLRHPGWGRAQECYSEDSYLTGLFGLAFVCGVQNNVLASPKHFAANNLEMTRFEMTANMDLRTLHEVYLPHFKMCLQQGGAASVMSAYNRLNGVYCGEHQQLLTEILRDSWGFKGFVESDWILGTRSTSKALKAGLDIEMPAPYRFSDDKLQDALASGDLLETELDARVRCVLHEKIAWNLSSPINVDESVIECAEHVSLAQEVAEQSMVLLKNDNQVLPLEDKAGALFALVGDLAKFENLGDKGSSFVRSSSVITPYEGILSRIEAASCDYFSSSEAGEDFSDYDLVVVVAGLTFREEGEFIPDKHLEPEDDDLARGGDRASLQLPAKEATTIERVAKTARRVVVVLEGGSAIEVRSWVDKVEGLLMAWYPGCEGGHAIARVLFGDVNPGAKLPVSFPRSIDQLMPWDIEDLVVDHDLLHGYRYLEHTGAQPEFPFGFGLSYTEFSLSCYAVERRTNGFKCSVRVKNQGARSGTAVVQLYVSVNQSQVFRVPQELKGFGKVMLNPGETITLEIELEDVSLCFYDENQTNPWHLEACEYEFKVGFSSADISFSSTWALNGVDWRQLSD